MRFDCISWMVLGLALGGCQGGGVYSVDDRPAEPLEIEAPAPTPLLELSCDDAPGFAERARYVGLSTPQMGVCGALSWTDAVGDFYFLPEGESTSQLLVSGSTRQVANRRNDTFMVSPDGATWTWMHAGVASEPFDASRVGFVRDGETEIAWACVDRTLGTVDEDGFSPRVDDIRLCERMVTASDAPVFVFVGPDFTLQAFDLRGPNLADLSEVPYVAAGTDRLRLSRDGRILAHQAGEVQQARVGLFDLERDPDDRLIGAPRPAGSIHTLRQAARAGHVMALPTEDSVVVVGPDARLYDYPGATLLGLDPSGASVLLSRPLDGGSEVFLGRPGGRDTMLSQVGPEVRLTRQSDHGAAVLFAFENAQSRNGTYGYISYRFGTEGLVRPSLSDRPNWLGDDGSMLVFGGSGVQLLDPYGIHRRTFQSRPTLFDLEGDRVIVLERLEDSSSISVVSTASGEITVLDRSDRWGLNVVLGADRNRVLAFQQVFDPANPTATETIIAAGRP